MSLTAVLRTLDGIADGKSSIPEITWNYHMNAYDITFIPKMPELGTEDLNSGRFFIRLQSDLLD